jgi:hypothetical protein
MRELAGWMFCIFALGCAVKTMRIARKHLPQDEHDNRSFFVKEFEQHRRLYKVPEHAFFVWLGIAFLIIGIWLIKGRLTR